MQHSGLLVNLPADLPIVQWLERCDNKETIIQSLKFEVIPPHSVVQSKGEGVKRCMFILEGKILQCDQCSKKNAKEVDGTVDNTKQNEGNQENTTVDNNQLIHPLERDNCTVLCAWELCENKVCKKLRKFPENPSQLQQQTQQRVLPSTLQKIISLGEGEMIGVVSGDQYQFSLKSEGECKVGRVSYDMLKWMLKLWAIGSDEELVKSLKSTMTRISTKSESVQQQFYLQNQFRFENRSASEAKLARETFVTSVKDLFMNKVQSNFQKVLNTEEQDTDQFQQQQCKTSINFDNNSCKTALISPKRSQQKRNSIRQHDSVLFLQKLTSNNNMNSPSSKDISTADLSLSVKEMALGHLNLFDQTPSNQEQKSQSSFSLSFQQQQQRKPISLQHRHSVSSYQSNLPTQLPSPKAVLYDPRQTDLTVFTKALPSINKISGDTPGSHDDTPTITNRKVYQQPRFHSFSIAFNSTDQKQLNFESPRNQHNLTNNQNKSPSNNASSPNFNTAQNKASTNNNSSFFIQFQLASKQKTTEKQSYLNISKSSNYLTSSSLSKDPQKNLTPREPSLNNINPQLLSYDQLASPSTSARTEKRASFSSQAAAFSDQKSGNLVASGKANLFPFNETTSTNINHYSFFSINSPTKSKEILKSKNILKNASNFKTLNNTGNTSANNLNSNDSPSTAHPLSHLKMKVDIDQLVKEKEIILTNLQERQKKNNIMNKKTIPPSGFEQDLSRKPSQSAHISSSSSHHKNLVKKAVRDLENSAYFSLDFGTDTQYRRGFLAKLSAKIANY